ncbi:kinetochore protein Spc25 [Microdochium nivale]|nr:kinetochore protein Spc25 [Microdochium nivale]
MLGEDHPRSAGTAYVSPRGSFSNSELYRASQPQTDKSASDRHESAMTDVDLGEARPATPPAGRNTQNQPLPQHRSPFAQHSRQHSTPSFPIPQSAPRSPSPLRSHLSFSTNNDMPNTGDGQGPQPPDTQAGGFGGWLRRSSTPSVHDAPISPDTTPKSVRASMASTAGGARSTPQSKLGLFASSVSAFANRIGNQPSTRDIHIDDELYNMDIETALFPTATSPTTDSDAFSPSAYKNLQANAVGLSVKMQSAYRQQTVALHEVQTERDAQQEEIEEGRLRIALFKTQLEDMATKAEEQEREMQKLIDELRAEKKQHRHVASSIASEDLGIDDERDRRRWRESSGTTSSAAETDAESGADEGESVFSRSRSPTVMTSITENSGPASVAARGVSPRPASLHVPSPRAQLPPRQLSTFQKIVKGITDPGSSDGCRNCKGQDASAAWNTVSLLRDENKGLKHRVAQLEVAVEGALDLVNGIGLA